jgi:hypothetical protein
VYTAGGKRRMLERRRSPRYTVQLPLRLHRVAGNAEPEAATLRTRDFSTNGLCFSAPRRVERGQSIEVEVILVGYGLRGNDVHVSGVGIIVRAEADDQPGWFRLAAIFDESPSEDGLRWDQLAAAFDEPPSSV